MLVRAQGVDGGTAVVDNAVQQTEFGGGTTHLTHANVDTDFGQAAVAPDVTQSGLQLLCTWFCVTKQMEKRQPLNKKKCR